MRSPLSLRSGFEFRAAREIPRPFRDEDWPPAWALSHAHDMVELWNDEDDPGYAAAYRQRIRFAIENLEAFRPTPARVLDVAAAQGNLTIELALRGYDVVWNDIRAELQDYVVMKLPPNLRVTFAPGDLFGLASGGDKFDAVLACEIIEHTAHPDEFLAAIERLLRPGGIAVLTTPNGGYFRNPLPRFSETPDPERFESVQFQPDAEGHIFLLDPSELVSLATRAHLSVVNVRTFTNPLTHGWAGTRRLRRHLPRGAVAALERATSLLPDVATDRLNTQLGIVLRRGDAISRLRHGRFASA